MIPCHWKSMSQVVMSVSNANNTFTGDRYTFKGDNSKLFWFSSENDDEFGFNRASTHEDHLHQNDC